MSARAEILVHPKHITTVAVKERRHPPVEDAVDVYLVSRRRLEDRAERREVGLGRSGKIDRNVNIAHPQALHVATLVRQRPLVRVQTKIDDMPNAETGDRGELLGRRLPRCGHASIEPAPVEDLFRIVHFAESFTQGGKLGPTLLRQQVCTGFFRQPGSRLVLRHAGHRRPKIRQGISQGRGRQSLVALLLVNPRNLDGLLGAPHRIAGAAREAVRFRQPRQLVGMIDPHAALLRSLDRLFQQVHALLEVPQAREDVAEAGQDIGQPGKELALPAQRQGDTECRLGLGQPAGEGKRVAFAQMRQRSTQGQAGPVGQTAYFADRRFSLRGPAHPSERPDQPNPVEHDRWTRRSDAGCVITDFQPGDQLTQGPRLPCRNRRSNSLPAQRNTAP